MIDCGFSGVVAALPLVSARALLSQPISQEKQWEMPLRGARGWPRRRRSGIAFGSAAGRQIPVENLRSVPVQHALESADVVIDRFEVFDPMRLAADVRMDCERHDLRTVLALGVEP